jgi:nucleotide-binding universal stress UspA family protein
MFMRTILCPVDFSETSIKALLYAYDIALATDAGLFLLHTYHIPGVVPLMEGHRQPEWEVHLSYEREALEKMDNLIYWLNKIHAPAQVKAVYKTVLAFAVDEIVKTAYEQDIDLIVLGTKNTRDLKSIFSGTNTVRVIEETHCPVCVVPASAPYASIKHILYTPHQTQPQETLFVNGLTKAFHAALTLIPVREKTLAASHQAQAMSGTGSAADNLPPLFNQVVDSGQPIQQTITTFVREHPATLLVISAGRRHLLDEVMAAQVSPPLHAPVLILQ